LPSPKKCCCPANSASFVGRIRAASGAAAARQRRGSGAAAARQRLAVGGWRLAVGGFAGFEK